MARILVIEADELVRSVIRRVLGRAGHEVEAAASATALWRLSPEEGAAFDLLIVDARALEDSFPAGLRRLREHQARLPVILLSAGPLPAPLRAEDGVPLLRKPFRAEDLVAMVERRLLSE